MVENNYKVELNETDRRIAVKGIFKILEEKGEGIKELCENGILTGEIYDCDIHVLNIILEDLNTIKETLYTFKNMKESRG